MRRIVGILCASMLMLGMAAAQDSAAGKKASGEKKAAKTEAKVAKAGAGASAAAEKSKWIGTWKLNTAKSDLKSDPNPPKALTVTITRDDDKALDWMAVGTDHQNKPIKYAYRGKADGKDYDVKGPNPAEKVAYTREGDNLSASWKDKDSKESGTQQLTMSEDGKTITVKNNFKGPDGKEVASTYIYEKVMPKGKAATKKE